MPITLEPERKAGLPVVKRTALEQVFNGAIVRVDQRDRQKRDEVTGEMVPVLKPNSDKARQELVLTCLTLPGTTAPVGLGTDEQGNSKEWMPAEGDLVRLILKGKAFSDWIQVKAELGRPVQVGDIVTQTTELAQVYDKDGRPFGKEITTQAKLLGVPRGRSIGIYGPITLREAKEGSEWVTKAEAAYHSLSEPIQAETQTAATRSTQEDPYRDVPPPDAPSDDDEPPF